LIYSHKPQRSGRSIPTNTNNPPQDPPSPPKDITLDDIPKVPYSETPLEPIVDIPIVDIPIKDTTPPVIDIEEKIVVEKIKHIAVKPKPTTPKKQLVIPKPVKQSIWKKLYNRIVKLWRR